MSHNIPEFGKYYCSTCQKVSLFDMVNGTLYCKKCNRDGYGVKNPELVKHIFDMAFRCRQMTFKGMETRTTANKGTTDKSADLSKPSAEGFGCPHSVNDNDARHGGY